MTARRYIYKGRLAQPLSKRESADDKLPLLYEDLGVSSGNDCAALIKISQRHVSGFKRAGPKTRRYPKGPLRSLLRPHEMPEGKLPLLLQYFGATTYRECLLACARVHVPGFLPASLKRTGGRPRATVVRQADDEECRDARLYKRIHGHRKDTGRRLKTAINDVAPGVFNRPSTEQRYRNARRRFQSSADADEAWICEIIDMLREETGATVRSIAEKLANEPAEPGNRNPAFGLRPKWIVDRYWNRKDYEGASDRRFQQDMAELAETPAVKRRLSKK